MAQVGFAIIGCGNIGPVHAEAINQARDAKLIAVSDIVEKNARKLAKQYGADCYTDYEKMLERDDIAVVNLCVPSGMRAEMAEACAAAGKHVLAEKPLEVNTKRIDRIIKATDSAGVQLGCIFQSRFAEGPRRIHNAVEKGRFGKLVLGDAYIKWYRSQAYYDSGEWRGTRALDGGGALMNQGIHQIDLLVWFMGDVKRVRAQTTLVGHDGLEVEDLACAMLEFENGAMGVIEGSTACWPGHPARIEVHGTNGSAVLEDSKLRFWQFSKRTTTDRKIEAELHEESELGSGAADPLNSLKVEGHKRQIQDFARSLKQGKPPFIEGREGRRAVELIEAIYKSAKGGGKPVTLR